MKKLLLISGILLGAAGMQAQQKATAEVSLTTGMTAKILLDDATNTATLTFTGPSDRWFALQIGSFTNSGGMDDGEDVVWYNGTTLVDGVHNGQGSAPSTDTNDWNVTSNTVSGTTRTIIATRDFDTGSADDYEFVYSDANIDFAWAKNSSASYTMTGHGANRGYDLNNAYTCVAPDAPTASAQSFCATEGATIADLEADGEDGATFEWYANAEGGSPLAETTVLANNTTYHVSQTVGDCESTRTSVLVTLTTTPLPTSTDVNPEFCSSATIADLMVSGQTGATFNWYANEEGGSPLATNTALAAGDYFVSQTVDGCESNRLEFNVTFVTLASPTLDDTTQEFCSEATVADLQATPMAGATLSWFENAEGGSALASGTVLVAGNYFVSQTLDGCVSDREEVTVSYVTLASPGVASATPVVCEGTTLGDIDVTLLEGAEAIWYAENDSETPLPLSTVLADGEDYFVEQMLLDCVSGRTGITPSIGELDAPEAPEEQAVCPGTTVDDLEAEELEGATVTWYLTVGGEPLDEEAEVTATTYFVTQTLNGCESAPAEVEVALLVAPVDVTGNTEQQFNEGETVADLEIVLLEGATANWYIMDEDELEPIPATTALVDGMTYYVTQTLGGCESLVPLAILVDEVLGSENFDMSSLMVYPNPVTDVLTISNKAQLSEVVIVNLLGQTVISQKAGADKVTVNTASLQNGTYILKVYTTEGGSASVKIVK